MKKIFMVVLYNEMKLVKRSRYLVTNTTKNRICDFPDIPAQLLDFQILSRSKMIAKRWDKSPHKRKIFIFSEKLESKYKLTIHT